MRATSYRRLLTAAALAWGFICDPHEFRDRHFLLDLAPGRQGRLQRAVFRFHQGKSRIFTSSSSPFPDESYPTIVSTALAGGKGGDVIHTHAYGWLEQFVKAGYFVKQDASNMPSLANMSADALARRHLSRRRPGLFLAFASQTLGLFINKDVFEKAGLTPPTTWDEFITVSKALKEKGIIPLATAWAPAGSTRCSLRPSPVRSSARISSPI
jgi:raffinose/stachyose/melibiose transport system substrate-binding protein